MSDGDIVFTRDTTSGRVHKRVWINDSLATLEACNQDDAGDFEMLDHRVGADDVLDLCRRCFPVNTT